MQILLLFPLYSFYQDSFFTLLTVRPKSKQGAQLPDTVNSAHN